MNLVTMIGNIKSIVETSKNKLAEISVDNKIFTLILDKTINDIHNGDIVGVIGRLSPNNNGIAVKHISKF